MQYLVSDHGVRDTAEDIITFMQPAGLAQNPPPGCQVGWADNRNRVPSRFPVSDFLTPLTWELPVGFLPHLFISSAVVFLSTSCHCQTG
jgi:hypothetical protein